ncbi:MmgE/PrpD family protein [Microbulbifer agarilyticus]|uniref:MmgE/PrpD family protein n=1 Tax=Microbulbifer agarilyticus TaxID=260552 RepID=UPI001CD3B8C9|nr:MmgE/PrpD family protein [Microbulbifer agarilyticus]MCA0892123.1 MmgE/PrpD family protein [Microbulbifer agarilyticus]
MNQPMTLLEQLVSLLDREIDDATLERAQLHLLDWLGCSVYGARSELAEKLRGYLAEWGTSGKNWNLNGSDSCWQDSVQFHGALGSVSEMDDLHRTSTLHPGPVIIPAALAVAEMVEASPRALLSSIVVGYEVMIRIGRALGRDHYALYHSTSTCGSFGAAAAAAHLLDLNHEQTVWALANAGSRTGGFWQMRHEAVETKHLHNAGAAHAGVQAALLASSELRGPASLLEGTQGFFAATSSQAMPLAVIDQVSEGWLLFQCSFKPWPACRHTHPTIDAVRALGEVSAEDVRELHISTFGDALMFCDRKHPESPAQARFSLQHCAAVTILFGAPAIEHFGEETLARPDVAELRDKVTLHVTEAHQRAYPAHFGATVRVVLLDGSEWEMASPDAWGDPEWPLTSEDIIDKARTLFAAAGVGTETTEDVLEVTLNLIGQDDLNSLFTALRGLGVSQ